MEPIKTDMRMVAERILNDYSGNVRSVSSPIQVGAGCKVHRYGLFGNGQMTEPDKLVLFVDGSGGYTAIVDPSTPRGFKREGMLSEFTHKMTPREIDDTRWQAAFFDPFLRAMVKDGFMDDRGRDHGVYGVQQFHGDEVAVVAWCYPPAQPGDADGQSKIVVRGRVPGGTKEDSFYFDSAPSFEVALRASQEYAAKRLLEAKQTIFPKAQFLEAESSTCNEAQKIVLCMRDGVVDRVYAGEVAVAIAVIDLDHRADDESAVLVPHDDGQYERARVQIHASAHAPQRRDELFALAERGPSADLASVAKEGVFSGPVLSIADGIITQRVRRDGLTAQHDASNLDMSVSPGDLVDIKYVSGLGVVTNSHKGQELGHG